jgi:hypothetical protein
VGSNDIFVGSIVFVSEESFIMTIGFSEVLSIFFEVIGIFVVSSSQKGSVISLGSV